MKTEYFDSAEVSDVGRKRKNNEDACICIPERGIYCVADGMGGQAGGDLASETIVTTIQQVFSKPEAPEEITLAQRVKNFRSAANQASKWIKDFADAKVIGQMGSTLVALLIDPRNPSRGVALHAGDSRLYQFRKGKFWQVTVDHSAVQAIAQKLGIHPDQVPAKYQNELLRAVGLTEAIELEKTPVDIASGDVFLICSDGLTKMIPDELIAKMLKDGAQTPVAQLTQKFIDDANAAGGKDNVTVVIIRAGDLSKAPKILPAEGEEDEKTATLAASEPDTSTRVPVLDAGTPRPSDSGDVHGDTPTTPTTPSVSAPPVEKTVTLKPEAPTLAPPRKEMLFVPAAKTEEKIPVEPAKKTDGKPQKNTSLIIGIIFAVLLVAAAAAWLVLGPKPKPPEEKPAATNAPAPKILITNIPASTANNAANAAAANQLAYAENFKNAQAAFDKGDYQTAVSLAAVALQKTPGDKAAAQLQAQAQAALQTQDAWRDAMKNAQLSLDAKNYTNAIAWADAALQKIPNEAGALKLRDQAAQQMAAAAAAAENDKKYSDAIAAAQAALKNNDPSAATKSAQAALAVRANDATANGIVQTSAMMMDMSSARRFFDEADYDDVLDICQQHATVADFKSLADACHAEQSALASAQSALANGDYATVAKLQPQTFARKAPFAAVLKQAADEQKLLADLTALQSAKNWPALQQKISVAPYAVLAGKPPFAALAQWAQAQADAAAQQKLLAQLNVTYEEMLVWFNVKKPTDPAITTADARKQSLFSGNLTDAQRQQYLNSVSMLEANFTKLGLINQNDRAKNLKELRDVISHHD